MPLQFSLTGSQKSVQKVDISSEFHFPYFAEIFLIFILFSEMDSIGSKVTSNEKSINTNKKGEWFITSMSRIMFWKNFGACTNDASQVKNHCQNNSLKSIRWSAIPAPCWVGCVWSWRGSRAAAPKGSLTYAFTNMGIFSSSSIFFSSVPPPSNPSLEA